MPIVVDRKGLGGAGPGDLALVRTGRGRARVEQVIGKADRIENVLQGPAARPWRDRRARAAHPARALDGRPHRPPRSPHVHDRPGDGEGLRRRHLDPGRGRRASRLRAYRGRLVLRSARHAARPRCGRARLLRLRARARRADAPARAGRRRLQPAAAPGPAHGHGRGAFRRGAPSGHAALLSLRDPQPRPAHLRAGTEHPRGPRAGGARGRGWPTARGAARDRAAPAAVRAGSAADRDARDRVRVRRRGRRRRARPSRASRTRTCSSRST